MARLNQAINDLYSYGAALGPQDRTKFNKSHSVSTTFDSGYLIPIGWDRVLPGDEKEIKVSALARMATPIHPTMDEAFLYTWAVYVPDRLWWKHAKEFYGENKYASFNPDGEYVMPYLKPYMYMCSNGPGTSAENSVGSLNDYLGMPFMQANDSLHINNRFNNDPDSYISAGLHRSYQLIWNELFRNSSIQPALQLNDGDTVSDTEWNVINKLRKVNKLPDQFTMLLREPQAGDDVLLPIQEYVPVVTTSATHGDPYGALLLNGNFSDDADVFQPLYGMTKGDGKHAYLASSSPENALDDADVSGTLVWPQNLWARFTAPYLGSINSLRQAVVVQHLLETDNVSGKRYQNILQAHFGVFTPDATVQRPELLGASRTSIGMRQVIQTSETSVTPQGNVSGVSVTNLDNEWICNKSFTEPGFIMFLAAVRPVHSYSQGIDPLLRKLRRYDHYWPVFANIGNQPVYVSEIFADLDYYNDVTGKNPFTDVFGWKSAWNEYRYRPNRVTGLMRPDVNASLATWNYSDYYKFPPALVGDFIEEDPELIDRTIATPEEPQFIADFYFDYFDTKSMTLTSVPGLLTL